MAVIAKTIGEARDAILKRINSENSTKMQTAVLEFLNDGMTALSQTFDWNWLKKKSTLTMPDSTGEVALPEDLDRILALHTGGVSYSLVNLNAQQFLSVKEEEYLEQAKVFTVIGYDRDTSTDNPQMKIEIYATPDAGDEFYLYYLKRPDALTDTSIVPDIPSKMWDLIQRWAKIAALRLMGATETEIQGYEKILAGLIEEYKISEKGGGAKFPSIKVLGIHANWKALRGRR
jgi:hypothetical protein